MALKQWMFPPLVGYRVVVGQGATMSISLTSFAGLAANSQSKPKFHVSNSILKDRHKQLIIFQYNDVDIRGLVM